VLGPDGPLGYATNVRITEINGADGRPETINVTARGGAMDVSLRFDVASAVTSRMSQGPLRPDDSGTRTDTRPGPGTGARTGPATGLGTGVGDNGAASRGVNFLQLQGRYTVTGRAGERTIDFTAPGAAETFRGD